MVGPLFAQTAWTNVTFVGSEVRDPERISCARCVIGCGIVVVLYLLANLAYLAVLPFSEIEHAPHNRVAVAHDERRFRSSGCDVHGSSDHDFHLRLQQRPDSFRRARLLCDGARPFVLQKGWNHQSLSCSGRCVGRAGNLDRASDSAAHGDTSTPRHMQVAHGNVYNQLLEYIVSADLLFTS